jgi:hypothetical protein
MNFVYVSVCDALARQFELHAYDCADGKHRVFYAQDVFVLALGCANGFPVMNFRTKLTSARLMYAYVLWPNVPRRGAALLPHRST